MVRKARSRRELRKAERKLARDYVDARAEAAEVLAGFEAAQLELLERL